MSKLKLKILNWKTLLAVLLVVAAGIWIWSMRASLKPDDVKVGMDTNRVRLSWKTFSYNEDGHFGKKIQYEAKHQDSHGGSLSLHCRDGSVYAVEAAYPAGLSKEESIKVARALLNVGSAQADEHDEEELHIANCEKPTEYFYFDGGKLCAQLDYKKNDLSHVTRVYCWKS